MLYGCELVDLTLEAKVWNLDEQVMMNGGG